MVKKTDLERAAVRIKEHLDYKLSGRWSMDGVKMDKDPYQWVREYDGELGTRCRTFEALFSDADAESRENAVKIFKPQLDRFLGKYDFPELEKFSERISVWSSQGIHKNQRANQYYWLAFSLLKGEKLIL